MISDVPATYSPEQLDLSGVGMPEYIVKRDGRTMTFDPNRIKRAMKLCFKAIGDEPYTSLDDLLARVLNTVSLKHEVPSVEKVQDIVEWTLAGAGEFKAAKAYILYRAEHTRLREQRTVSPEVKEAFDQADQYFPTQLQKFQFFDKYSRYRPDLGRRETWLETVDRSVSFLEELVATNVNATVAGGMVAGNEFGRIREAILSMRAMPSMRLLAMAGPAARRQNIAVYNCSTIPVDSVEAFSEALLISMSGCGVGFSVERRHVDKLPIVGRQMGGILPKWVVEDSTEGWVEAVNHGLRTWLDGYDVEFDYSQVRPKGAVLKVKGGRASGPDPLRDALQFARERILARQGKRLRPLDCHDIMCQIGNAAVSGGVRRTAMISLFDPSDTEMANCKVGDEFETENNQRWNANNSFMIPEEGISQDQFDQLWQSMLDSGRGEPGIISRQAMKATMPARRNWDPDFATNPCGEIILKKWQFCNLSIAVARPDDTLESLKDKVEVAAIIGTIQSLATHFPGLRPQWRQNAVEERLLGVDITGQRDCRLLEDPEVLRTLREHVIETNRIWSERFGINQAAATTCVKPSGNSSVLLDVASGLHPRWAPYYIRRVRVSATSPVAGVLRDSGVNLIPENGQNRESPNTWVVEFPVKSPEGTMTREDLTAIDQFDYWKHVKLNWTEHNPSVTVSYRPEEVEALKQRVWDNLGILGGMSFLPRHDAKLPLLPYEPINRDEYERRVDEFPNIDFGRLVIYEHNDETTASQTLSCMSGNCEDA